MDLASAGPSMGSVTSHPLFWPSGRKLFRQRARGRVAWVAGCALALAVMAAALFKLGWI